MTSRPPGRRSTVDCPVFARAPLRTRRALTGSLVTSCLAGLCLLLGATVCAAQPRAINFRGLGVEDGLSQGSVHALHQDRQGFLWLATQAGLNRWDGQRFEVYRHDPMEPTSLAASHVWAITEDRAGHLWLGTDGGGLDRLDAATGDFEHHRHDPNDASSLPSDRVRALLVDRRGVLWVGTDEGLARRRPEDLTAGFERIETVEREILTLVEDADGSIWAGTRDGAERVRDDGAPAVVERFAGVGPSAAERQVRAILRDRSGRLWLGTYGGLARIDRDGSTQVFRHRAGDPSSLPHDRVRSILEDREGRLWVGTDGGLAVYRPAEPGFHVYRHDPSWPGSLPLDAVLTVFQDHGGVLWVATQGRGLQLWHPTAWTLGPYRARDEPGSLGGDVIMAFAEDPRGDLWIGTLGNGLQRWDRGEGRFETWRHDPDDPSTLAQDRVTALAYHQPSDELWVGTFSGGLDRLAVGGSGVERLRHERHDPDDPTSLAADGVTTLLTDRAGDLWIGTFGGGLDRYDRAREVFVHHRHDPDDPTSLPSDRISALAEGRDHLWVGTLGGGLARFDRARGELTRFRHDRGDLGSLGADDVFSLYVDTAADTLWVGTKGGGLQRLKNASTAEPDARFHTFSERDGLPSGTVYGIVPDDEGRLWLSTPSGLAALDPRRAALDVYKTRHGLLSEELNFGAHFRSRRGELFFGGVRGFNAFFPATVETNDHVPPIVVTSIETSARDLGHGEDLILDHAQASSFSFEYAALDFNAPAAQRFRVRLEGFDDAWIDAGNRRRVTYTNMGPGRYVFRVKASNGDGVWNETGVAAPLEIRPALWQTWWAWIGYALLLASLGYAGARWRHRGITHRSEELERTVAERTEELESTVERLVSSEREARDARRRALRSLAEALEERRRAQDADRAKSVFLSNMSHELRTPLNAVLGFAQLLERDQTLTPAQREHLEVILHSGEHLLRLIEDSLSLSKIEAGKLTLDHRPFDPGRVLTTVEEMLRVRAESKGLRLEIESDPHLPTALYGDEGRLLQVLLNLAGNAVKFTDQGSVRIESRWRAGAVTFRVVDTGRGIDAHELELLFEPFEHTASGRGGAAGAGLGLAISRELVQLMGGELEVHSRPAKGTVFSFTLPFEAAERGIARAQGPPRRLAPGQEVRVLVADDSRPNRVLVTELMRALGASVQAVADGAEAVEVWHQDRPRLIWMDLRMPGLSGEDATRRIRRLEADEGVEPEDRTRIVALTATAFADDVARLRETGLDDVVLKPCRAEVLAQTMEDLLDVELIDPRGAAAPGRDRAPEPRPLPSLASPKIPGAEVDDHAPRILLVDDQEVNRVVTSQMLERLGHACSLAESGDEVLGRIDDGQRFDLFLMDVRMQPMDGCTVTRELRRRGVQSPIIGLTGLSGSEARTEILAAGMNDVLTKPFRIRDLEQLVERWLATGVASTETSSTEPPSTSPSPFVGEPTPPPADERTLDTDWLRVLDGVDRDASSPVLAHVVDLFGVTAPRRLDEMRDAAARRDHARLEHLAERLRDTAEMLGAESVVSSSRRIERLAEHSASPSAFEKALTALEREVQRAIDALEGERAAVAESIRAASGDPHRR